MTINVHELIGMAKSGLSAPTPCLRHDPTDVTDRRPGLRARCTNGCTSRETRQDTRHPTATQPRHVLLESTWSSRTMEPPAALMSAMIFCLSSDEADFSNLTIAGVSGVGQVWGRRLGRGRHQGLPASLPCLLAVLLLREPICHLAQHSPSLAIATE